MKPAVGNTPGSFQWDYFLKDHLGNVRMVLTEEQQTQTYDPATMETGTASTEEQLYTNMTNTRTDKPNGYPYDPYLDPNNKVAKVRGDGQKIGPGIVLKVMAGDKFNLRVSSWYKTNGMGMNQPYNALNDLIFMLNYGIGNAPGSKATTQQLQSNGVVNPGALQHLTNHPYDPAKPKAYVSWVLFDEQFKFVASSSGAEQVGGDQEFSPHVKSNMPVDKNGYLYVYVSMKHLILMCSLITFR